ncbi:hypothetical protein RB595_004995 [Gaeumannomyces hyphopodioides]
MSAAVQSTSGPLTMSADPHHHHNRDFALQKYLLLQEQHESLQHHIDQLRPAAPPMARRSPSVASSTASSTRHHQRQQFRHGSVPTAAAPFGLETVPDERTLHEVAAEEARLFDVNEGIKRALTELLNCETVRADRALRTWVQGRLLETERELRTGRRRRSAPGAAEHY